MAVSVTVRLVEDADSGYSGDADTLTLMSRHSTATGADSPDLPDVYATTTLKNLTPAELDDTLFVAEVEAAPRLVHEPFSHSCHRYDDTEPAEDGVVAVSFTVCPVNGLSTSTPTVGVVGAHAEVALDTLEEALPKVVEYGEPSPRSLTRK